MPCGVFGKLPAKRDFIALAVPRTVLTVWEPWIQGGLTASRLALGSAWTAAYLRAPIWRFWLGSDLAGSPVLGAFMPSADGIGRYFPLTLVCPSDHLEGFAPPEVEPFDAWFSAAEAFLLSTLAEGARFEAVAADLAALPEAVPSRLPASFAGARRLSGNAIVGRIEGGDVPAALTRLRPLTPTGFHVGMSYWWTMGGEEFPAYALAAKGMPDPHLFAAFLTGGFDASV